MKEDEDRGQDEDGDDDVEQGNDVQQAKLALAGMLPVCRRLSSPTPLCYLTCKLSYLSYLAWPILLATGCTAYTAPSASSSVNQPTNQPSFVVEQQRVAPGVQDSFVSHCVQQSFNCTCVQ